MSTFKNLFERLKPEIREKILSEQSEYPTHIGSLIKEMEKNVAVTEMKLGDLTSISNFCKGYCNSINDLYNMFEDI